MKRFPKMILTVLLSLVLIFAMSSFSIAEDNDTSYFAAKALSSGTSSLDVSWAECEGAAKYQVYANIWCAKTNLKKVASIEGTSYTLKKLKKNTFYKLKVVALDEEGKKIASSKMIYAATNGYMGRYGNVTEIKAKDSQIELLAGESSQVGVESYEVYKNKKAFKFVPKVRYISSNENIAKVDSKGNVTGVSEGICTIYMQAPDGLWAETNIMVFAKKSAIVTPASGMVSSEEDAVVKLTYMDNVYYYDNFNDAWEYANKEALDSDCELTFLADWVAEKDSGFGEGTGYGSTGDLTPVDRKDDSIKLTIDLNGHTIDRNQSEEVSSGGVFSIKKDGVYTVKNGTVTGGNTKDRGGAFWLDNDETTVNLENLNITGNHADGNGGAILVKKSKVKVNIEDCSITGNSSDNYGGAMYVCIGDEKITLSGVVVVKDNEGKNSRNNITVQRSEWDSAYISDCSGLEEGSRIYVAFSNFRGGTLVKKINTAQEWYFYCDAEEKELGFRVWENTLEITYY